MLHLFIGILNMWNRQMIMFVLWFLLIQFHEQNDQNNDNNEW